MAQLQTEGTVEAKPLQRLSYHGFTCRLWTQHFQLLGCWNTLLYIFPFFHERYVPFHWFYNKLCIMIHLWSSSWLKPLGLSTAKEGTAHQIQMFLDWRIRKTNITFCVFNGKFKLHSVLEKLIEKEGSLPAKRILLQFRDVVGKVSERMLTATNNPSCFKPWCLFKEMGSNLMERLLDKEVRGTFFKFKASPDTGQILKLPLWQKGQFTFGLDSFQFWFILDFYCNNRLNGETKDPFQRASVQSS